MRIVFVDLVAPGHLEIADLDRVTVLDATLPELIQDAGPVEDTLEAVRRLPLVEVRHLREPLDTHARNDVAILFDLLDFPRPLVDVADRVDASLRPGLLELLLFRFMQANLAHHVADPVVERLDALTGRGGDLVQLVSLAAENLLQARQVVPRFLQVDLVEDNQHGLVTHARIELEQLAVDRPEILQRIAPFKATRSVKDVEQQLRPAYVPEELVTEPVALSRALDQPGDVGHDERIAASTADLDHPEVWLQRRERVVGNLRPGPGRRRQQGRLTGVRQPDEPDIGDQAQLEPQPVLDPRLAQLGDARRLAGRRLEVDIAEAALAALRD